MRKIAVGRTDAYEDEEEVQAVVHCLRSLRLLPAVDTQQGFADIKTILSDGLSSTTALEQLIRYTKRLYITSCAVAPALC